MQRIRDGRWLARRPSRLATVVALAGLFVVGVQAVGLQAGGAAAPGFAEPFAGTPQYQGVAPTEISYQSQVNQPLGQVAADEIAREIGLDKSDVLTPAQYLAFITGQGKNGSGNLQSAELVDESVKILTNTVGHPLAYKDDSGHVVTSVLASYGLFVTTTGELESPAYSTAPTYLVNKVIQPTGYMGTWMRANGATNTLLQLYKSAYTSEVVYGNAAQQSSEPAELITNTKGGVSSEVGMSMGPALWIVNFRAALHVEPVIGGRDAGQVGPHPCARRQGDRQG